MDTLLFPRYPILASEITTLEPDPHGDDQYIISARGFCGRLHHMLIPRKDLARLLWPADALRGTVRDETDTERPTVGDGA